MSQAQIASWWKTNARKKGTDDVVAHTPDPSKYHSTSVDSQHKVKGGPRGLMGAMIPRARSDGTSRGFNAHRAGVVIIDPDSPDGGRVFDPRKVSNALINRALASVDNNVGYGRDTDDDTWSVYEQLSKPLNEATQEETTPEYLLESVNKPNPNLPAATDPYHTSSYVTPKSSTDGTQIIEKQAEYMEPIERHPVAATHAPRRQSIFDKPAAVQPVISLADPATGRRQAPVLDSKEEQQRMIVEQKQPVVVTSQSPFSKIIQEQEALKETEMATDPALLEALGAISGNLSTLSSRITAIEQKQAAPPAPSDPQQGQMDYRPDPTPARSVIRPKRAQVVEPSEEQPLNPYEALGIPFLTELEPSKPKHRVIFERDNKGGTHAAFYHAVIEGDTCLTLVYDTRYEGGNQFVPPESSANEKLTVKLPASKGKEAQTFNVLSVGLKFDLGCFDFVVLMVDPGDGNQARVGADILDLDEQ